MTARECGWRREPRGLLLVVLAVCSLGCSGAARLEADTSGETDGTTDIEVRNDADSVDAEGDADGNADADAGRDADVGADADADGDADTDGDADADGDVEAEVGGDAGGDDDAAEADAAPRCGNGVVEPGEECDSEPPRACTTSCSVAGSQACVGCHWETACCAAFEVCGNGCDDDCDTSTDEAGCGIGTPCSDDTACSSLSLVCNENWGICIVPDCTDQANFTPCRTITVPDRSYDICVGGACVSPGCGDTTCNAPGPDWPLPDTNQRTCYDNSLPLGSCPGAPGTPDCETTDFCGQDAQYGWDTTHAATERFTRTESTAGEPIVTDNVTGLIWQGCSAGLTGSVCATGLTRTYVWTDALEYCDSLSWGGWSDWRLPDRFELQSIVDYGRTSPPAIDPVAFPATPSNWFWSSSSYSSYPSWAWYVYFYLGYADVNDMTNALFVRCVRRASGTDVSVSRFTRPEPVAGHPVVADAATGLVWQGCAAGFVGASCTGTAADFTWQAALDYCQDSTWAGFDDWYLPDVGELTGIVDDTRREPSIDTTAFPETPLTYFWSSSSYAGAASTAWYVAFGDGSTNYRGKLSTYDVRCVRRGP